MKHVHMTVLGQDSALVERLGALRTYSNDNDARRGVYESIDFLRSLGWARWNGRAGDASTWTLVLYKGASVRPSLLTITLLACYCDESEIDEPPTCAVCQLTATGELVTGPDGLVAHQRCADEWAQHEREYIDSRIG